MSSSFIRGRYYRPVQTHIEDHQMGDHCGAAFVVDPLIWWVQRANDTSILVLGTANSGI